MKGLKSSIYDEYNQHATHSSSQCSAKLRLYSTAHVWFCSKCSLSCSLEGRSSIIGCTKLVVPVYTAVHKLMAGETGGGGTGRDPPFRAPSISSPGWDPEWEHAIYDENGPFFTSLRLFFSNCNSCIGGFGPFDTLGDPFPRGPARPNPLHLWNHFSSPAQAAFFPLWCLFGGAAVAGHIAGVGVPTY